MRPPRCTVCGAKSQPNLKFKLLSFKLSEEDKAHNERMKERRMVGHPRGREWFCEKHVELGKKYQHLTLKEARLAIKDLD